MAWGERVQQSGHGPSWSNPAWNVEKVRVRIEWIKMEALKRDVAHIMHARLIDCAPPVVPLYLHLVNARAE